MAEEGGRLTATQNDVEPKKKEEQLVGGANVCSIGRKKAFMKKKKDDEKTFMNKEKEKIKAGSKEGL